MVAVSLQMAEWAGKLKKGEVPVPQAAWSIPGGDSELLHRFLSASQRFEWGPEDQQPSSPDSQTSSSG